MQEEPTSMNTKNPRQHSLVKEKAFLDEALSDANLKLEQAIQDNIDPTAIEEKLGELGLKIEAHELRILQKTEDAILIFAQGNLGDMHRAEDVQKLLGEDLSLIMLRIMLHEDEEMRRMAVFSLPEEKDSACLKGLCEVALRDKYYTVRDAAALQLRDTKDPETLTWLREIGLRDYAGGVRRSAAEALHGASDAASIKALVKALNDSYEFVRKAAAESLYCTTDPEALDSLRKIALHDESLWARRAAITALTGTTDPDCREALERLLRDPSRDIFWAAHSALKGEKKNV